MRIVYRIPSGLGTLDKSTKKLTFCNRCSICIEHTFFKNDFHIGRLLLIFECSHHYLTIVFCCLIKLNHWHFFLGFWFFVTFLLDLTHSSFDRIFINALDFKSASTNLMHFASFYSALLHLRLCYMCSLIIESLLGHTHFLKRQRYPFAFNIRNVSIN